jgi:hypothetical protein
MEEWKFPNSERTFNDYPSDIFDEVATFDIDEFGTGQLKFTECRHMSLSLS